MTDLTVIQEDITSWLEVNDLIYYRKQTLIPITERNMLCRNPKQQI